MERRGEELRRDFLVEPRDEDLRLRDCMKKGSVVGGYNAGFVAEVIIISGTSGPAVPGKVPGLDMVEALVRKHRGPRIKQKRCRVLRR